MKGGRLAEIGERWSLSEGQLRSLSRLVELLATDEHAPTSVRDPVAALDRHIADSLSGLSVHALRSAGRSVDIGSGAGFPGLPLAVALPSCEFVLLEAQRKRCDFLGRAVETADAAGARVVCSRAESWRDGLEWADAVTARALAPQPVVLEWAAPLLRVGGTLVDWRGARSPVDEMAAAVACAELGLQLRDIADASPFDGAREHRLHVFEKVSPTPPRFPRRDGIARKRPLG